MATHEPDGFGNGFPFSPSPFGKIAVGACRILARANLAHARITDDRIPEGHAPFSAGGELSLGPGARVPHGAAHRAPASATPGPTPLADALTLPVSRPYAQRPIARQTGLRLLPLGSFVWGARGTPPRPRTRADHCLIWVTQGYAQLDLPRQDILMPPDMLRFVPAGTAFAFMPRAGAEGHVLLLAPRLTEDIDPPLPDRMIAGLAGSEGTALAMTLQEMAIESTRPGGEAGLHCLLGMLALRLGRLRPVSGQPDPAALRAFDRPLLDQFLTLARARLTPGLTVAELAEELGTTSAALDHVCQTAHGKRAIAMIHQIRLEQAIARLRETRQSPSQIARELGYASQAHFTRAFVEATGRRPEVFRNQSASMFGPSSSDPPWS